MIVTHSCGTLFLFCSAIFAWYIVNLGVTFSSADCTVLCEAFPIWDNNSVGFLHFFTGLTRLIFCFRFPRINFYQVLFYRHCIFCVYIFLLYILLRYIFLLYFFLLYFSWCTFSFSIFSCQTFFFVHFLAENFLSVLCLAKYFNSL